MSFKLLAIRPLDGCNNKFLKNLKPNQIYKFYDDYKFLDKNGNEVLNSDEVTSITYESTIPEIFFGENINISAIVGKNGSGKSSLIELLYVAMYNFAVDKKIIKPEENKPFNFDFKNLNNVKNDYNIDTISENTTKEVEKSIKILHQFNYNLHNKYKEIVDAQKVDKINVQIFYQITKEIYILQFKDDAIEIYRLDQILNDSSTFAIHTTNEGKCQFTDAINNDKILDFLFYNIVNNYSLYSLNSNEIGDWVERVFHKNDGYQTPIVINPMRTEGNIDVNREAYLTKSRLLSNILQTVEKDIKGENSLRNLTNNKIAEKLLLTLDFNKFFLLYKNEYDENNKYHINIGDKHIYLKFSEKHQENHLVKILTFFYPQSKYKIDNENKLQLLTIEYLLKKIISITEKYDNYREFEGLFDDIYLFDEFLKRVIDDASHIIYKLRQAINFIFFDFYDLKIDDILDEKHFGYSIETISDFIVKKVDYIKGKYAIESKLGGPLILKDKNYGDTLYIERYTHLIYFVPPSFLNIDISFKDNQGFFNQLSSGEKQQVYGFASIIYHLSNLASVQNLTDNYGRIKKYGNCNIIFDEIELYFHPEMQRTFINDLLANINRIPRKVNHINILFITHSPFILSDIPKQNVLFLEVEKEVNEKNESVFDMNGKKQYFSTPKPYKEDNTFAGNVHEMLTNGFFLENTKGAFAISKINEFLEFYKKNIGLKEKPYNINNDLENYSKMINLVGEDYVRKILENHLIELKSKFNDKSFLEIESDKLIKRLREINPDVKIDGI